MDSLAGYSSGSDSENQEDPEGQKLPEFDNFVLYSENYSMKKHGISSAFLCLPWKVSNRALFRRCYDKTLKEIVKAMPDAESRFAFHSTVQSKAEVFGRYGITQKSAVNFPHITLFPNLHGERSKLKQLDKRLSKAIKEIRPPPELVRSLSLALDAMTGTLSRKLSLRIDPKLYSYVSSVTGNIFVAINIIGPTRFQELPEKTYLRQLMGAIHKQVDALGFRYNWSNFVGGIKENNADGLPEVNFHSLVIIGEVKLFDKRFSKDEFERFKTIVRDIDISEFVNSINLEVETMYLRSNARVSAEYPLLQ